MDSETIFTKTAKGLMEATGKTSALSRDMRALLREIDGRATVAEVQARYGKLSEAKLLEALQGLANDDYVREFTRSVQTPARPPITAAPPRKASAESEGEDLDFTAAIPTISTIAKQAEEAARQKAQARAAAEAAARAKAEAEARAKAAAEAAARAKAAAEAKARAEAAARAKAEAEARARIAAEAAAKAKAEAEAKARAEAAARAKAEAEARAKRDAEERVRREAEERARKEAEARAKAEEQARIEAEARARKEAEERARVEAELKAKLEEERRAREEAERRAREQAERERREAEEKARREADELRAKLEEERKAREEAERRAKEDAERRAREDAERKAREEAERERQQAEENARREAEVQARREAEERAGAQQQSRIETEARARRDAEEAEREAKEASERARREAEEAERRAKETSERERREAEEKAARAAAEQARAQAPVESGPTLDDLVKIETDFDAVAGAAAPVKPEAERPRDSADDRMLRAVEEQARREAEEKARSAAEEKARKEADAAAQRAEEETGRKGEQEERRPKESELPGTREQQLAEAQALMQAQDAETERHFAEMEKEIEAEQAAGQAVAKVAEQPPAESPRDERKREKEERKRDKEETRERVRAAAAERALEAEAVVERAPAAYRTPINWGKPVALGLFLILVLGLVLVHFVSFDGSIPQFEKLAATHLQQPVKIKALHLSLVPQPHWRLDGVSVGNEGQLAVPRINATAELGSMFSDKKVFKSIELESPVLSEQGLVALLFGKSQGQDFKVASVIVKNGKLDSKTIILPALDAKIALGEDGAWRQIALETPDHKTSLMLKPEGEGAELEVETNAFSLPFDPSFILENFTAKGVIRRGELKLSELKGGIYGGFLSGNASLKWGTDWSLGGEVSVRVMDPARFAPALFEEGKLEGKAVYAMRAKSYDELFAAPRLEGSFSIQKGALLGVELGRLLQGGGVGGKTTFAELTGSFTREAGKTQLRQIHLGAGPVSAAGTAEADAGKRLSGRFVVEMKSPVAQARANLTLSGTLREPRFSR